MRLEKLLLLIPFLGASLAGCIKEDRSDCDPEYNLEFLFEYTTEPDTEFTELIKSVDMLLFDANSYFLEHRQAFETDLTEFQGMRFSLAPGIYYVVAWGNVGEYSGFSDFTTDTEFSQANLHITDLIEEGEGGDPVYYAPYKEQPYTRSGGTATRGEPTLYEVHVLSGRTTVKQLDFVKAHRTINVWIHGYENSGVGEALHPAVRCTQLWNMYNFYFVPMDSRSNYRKQTHAETISGNEYSATTFYSALGAIDGGTDITVRRSSDDLVGYTLNLKQFVQDNHLLSTIQVDILIAFSADMGVSITVPQWTEIPVQPGTN